jgi:methylenetetrahydrofolate dehydrogenase (NADP+)/methenyltetrahydrofolate cyclohydrolase
MSAIILDGKELAKSVQAELKARVVDLTPKLGRAPGLAVVLVGEDPASKVYVSSKGKKARKCGIEAIDCRFPANVSNTALQSQLRELSERDDVDGVLLQLPLPKELDEFGALTSIDPLCDADGLHPLNQGLLLRGAEAPIPCTPKGIMRLIDLASEHGALPKNLSGLNAVVVGRSVLVGKPIGLLLLERHCTVTYCHSRTKDLPKVCSAADILVAAVGRPEMINGDYIKQGATVIDVGINRTAEGALVGDVKASDALEKAGAYTPVPGGVGPMTIAMLLENTVEAAQRKI